MVDPRELEQNIGHQSAAVPRIKFHRAGISGAPGSGPAGSGANISGYNSERSYAIDISHGGSPSE
jgi:hypothetical protein